jgi:hypothetical protein
MRRRDPRLAGDTHARRGERRLAGVVARGGAARSRAAGRSGAADRRGDHGNIASLLVVRHGPLAVEKYFNGWTADRAHTMQSVTKSVVSLLVGLTAGAGGS